jgi:hypothetical protein
MNWMEPVVYIFIFTHHENPAIKPVSPYKRNEDILSQRGSAV